MATLYAGKTLLNKRPRNSNKGTEKMYTPKARDKLYKKFSEAMSKSGPRWVKIQQAGYVKKKRIASAREAARRTREATALDKRKAREDAKAAREEESRADKEAKERVKVAKAVSKFLAGRQTPEDTVYRAIVEEYIPRLTRMPKGMQGSSRKGRLMPRR